MEDIFGQTLVGKKGQVPIRSLQSIPLVLIYASASWCPPCCAFLPNLLQFYENANSRSKQLEIVWLSLDRSVNDFNNTIKTVPWLAVPYNVDFVEEIFKNYGIETIPKLYLINRDGSLAHTECREDVVSKGQSSLNEWLGMRS